MTKPKARYLTYKCSEAPYELTEKVWWPSFAEARKAYSRMSHEFIFVKELAGHLALYARAPFWNAWAWSDWVNEDLEEKLRKDLGL